MIHLDVVNRLIWGFQEPITTQDNTTNNRRSLSAVCFVKAGLDTNSSQLATD